MLKIKPEFPQYSPFYLEILLKERKNRNKNHFLLYVRALMGEETEEMGKCKKWPIYNI